MRIEGTYTFPAAIERVFAALADPEALGGMLPGCERLIQFGPAATDGAASFEARLRPAPEAGIYTIRITGVAARRPAHLRLALRGRGPLGPLTGSGLIDLVAQDDFTIGAYVFDVDVTGVPEERVREALVAAQRFARTACERLAGALRPEHLEENEPERVPAGSMGGRQRIVARGVRTARGRIIALPAAPSVSPLSATADAWMERIGWMATGMVLGMAALGLLVAVSRWWLGERGE